MVCLIIKKFDYLGFVVGFDISILIIKGGEFSNLVEVYINIMFIDDLVLCVVVYNEKQGGWIDNLENDLGNGGYIGSVVVID